MMLSCRVAAAILVVAVAASLWMDWTVDVSSPLKISSAYPYTVAAKRGSDPGLRRVRIGDRLDLDASSISRDIDAVEGTARRPIDYALIDGLGHRYRVVLAPVRGRDRSGLRLAITSLSALAAIGAAVLLLLRRPSALSLTFAAYCGFAIPTRQLILAISTIPDDTVRLVLDQAAYTLTAYSGSLAIVAFAMRFPTPIEGIVGRIVTRIIDVAFIALVAVSLTLNTFALPFFEKLIQVLAVVSIVAVSAIIALRYARSDGTTRRRLGWVLFGAIVSAAASNAYFLNPDLFIGNETVNNVNVALTVALPITVGYAVLRHRVLDLGFVLNRTLVYAALTTTLILAVSFIDWIVGKLLSQTQLATALEALVTVGFGVLLNTLHERIGRAVERVLFRERHTAIRRLEGRIDALDYAETEATVDQVLVHECAAILRIRSAAVFREIDDGEFACTASLGWGEGPHILRSDHVLVRLMRARERSLELAVDGIVDPAFPIGDERPDIAIPIVRRHRIMGIVVYGHRDGELALDPQERALLERLALAAANAYDSIEAAEWRGEIRNARSVRRLSVVESSTNIAPA